MSPDCFLKPTSLDDVTKIAELCGGPNWQQTALLGFEALAVILVLSGILAAVIMRVRH